MPSEYTDEIENSSYTWRAFSMGRKSKYSAEEKLLILNEVLRNGIFTQYPIPAGHPADRIHISRFSFAGARIPSKGTQSAR